MRGREPASALFNDSTLTQIDLAVNAIREVNPNTHIILSYIPTSAGIYGDKMMNCPDYANDLALQEENSQILANRATDLNIYYVDFTSTLREHAQSQVIWSYIDHFSPEGYELYAQLLADQIEPMLSQSARVISEAGE